MKPGAETVSKRRRSTRADAYHEGLGASPHRLLADHLTSEFRVKTQGRGRTVDEWKLRVDGADNHWLDCLVGCAVAASMQGAVLFGTDERPAPVELVSFAAMQQEQRARRGRQGSGVAG